MRADDELLDRARLRLFTAVLSDTLDALGRRDQAFRPGIRPLDESLVLFGRARTGLYAEVYSVAPGENPTPSRSPIDDLGAVRSPCSPARDRRASRPGASC